MKKCFRTPISYAMIIGMGLFIGSCDLIDDLTEFDVDTVMSVPADIVVDQDDDLEYIDAFNLVFTDPDIQDNLDNIKNYTINSVKYGVISYSGDESILVSGNVQIGASASVILNNVSLYDLWVTGQTVDSGLTNDQLQSLASELSIANSLAGTISIILTDKPMFATIEVLVDVTATVDGN